MRGETVLGEPGTKHKIWLCPCLGKFWVTARTNELQELTNMLESERRRLFEMVELAPFSILVLRGHRLLVEAYNPRYTPLVEAKVIQDRSLEEVFEHFWPDEVALVRLAQEVYQQNVMRTTSRIPYAGYMGHPFWPTLTDQFSSCNTARSFASRSFHPPGYDYHLSNNLPSLLPKLHTRILVG
jgi:hypothetical protein